MEIKNKQALFDEISFFKQNSLLVKMNIIVLFFLVLSITLLVILIELTTIGEYVPDNFYNYVYLIKENYYIFICVLPIIISTFFIIIYNKINDIINNKVAKYLGRDIQTNSEINSIDFELLSDKVKSKHFKNSLKTITKITGKDKLYSFFYSVYRTSKLNCVLNCLYKGIYYEITVLNTYWEKRRQSGKITYVEDYGTDYFAIVSLENKYFNGEFTGFLSQIPIEYRGYEISHNNKTNLLIDKKHKIKIKGKLVEKINMDIELAEEVIEKAIILAEYIIDNN